MAIAAWLNTSVPQIGGRWQGDAASAQGCAHYSQSGPARWIGANFRLWQVDPGMNLLAMLGLGARNPISEWKPAATGMATEMLHVNAIFATVP
ncbi:MAG: hypothetical protein ACRD2D_06050 [Terriglobales bacterium]